MRCDVVAVGTELLLGQIVDTNSAWIGEHLAALASPRASRPRSVTTWRGSRTSCARCSARPTRVIVCGGLGPTQDDVTREAIAAVMGAELKLDDDVAEVIRELFGQLRRPMSENNLRQAMVPVGAR